MSGDVLAWCATCGRELRAGDTLCNHTELEKARAHREGCAAPDCDGTHDAEVTITLGGDES